MQQSVASGVGVAAYKFTGAGSKASNHMREGPTQQLGGDEPVWGVAITLKKNDGIQI